MRWFREKRDDCSTMFKKYNFSEIQDQISAAESMQNVGKKEIAIKIMEELAHEILGTENTSGGNKP